MPSPAPVAENAATLAAVVLHPLLLCQFCCPTSCPAHAPRNLAHPRHISRRLDVSRDANAQVRRRRRTAPSWSSPTSGSGVPRGRRRCNVSPCLVLEGSLGNFGLSLQPLCAITAWITVCPMPEFGRHLEASRQALNSCKQPAAYAPASATAQVHKKHPPCTDTTHMETDAFLQHLQVCASQHCNALHCSTSLLDDGVTCMAVSGGWKVGNCCLARSIQVLKRFPNEQYLASAPPRRCRQLRRRPS